MTRCTKRSYPIFIHSIVLNENGWKLAFLDTIYRQSQARAVESILQLNLVLNHVSGAVALEPEPRLVDQLTFQPITGLLHFHQVDELQIEVITIYVLACQLLYLQNLHLRVKDVLLLQHFFDCFVVNHAWRRGWESFCLAVSVVIVNMVEVGQLNPRLLPSLV